MKVVSRNEEQVLLMVSSKSYHVVGLILFLVGILAIYLTGPKIIVSCKDKSPGNSEQCQLREVYLGIFTAHVNTFSSIKQLRLTAQGLEIISPEKSVVLGTALIATARQKSNFDALSTYHRFEEKKSLILQTHSALWEQALLVYLVAVGLSGMVFIGHAYIFLDKKNNRFTYTYRRFFSRKESVCELSQITAVDAVEQGKRMQLQLHLTTGDPLPLLKNVLVSRREKQCLGVSISDFLGVDNLVINKSANKDK